jgi:hypothetical protein
MLSSNGTYFVSARISILIGNASPVVGLCGVFYLSPNATDSFQTAINGPVGSAPSFSATGMIQVSQAPVTLQVGCEDNSSNPVTIFSVRWWVSKIS